MFIKTDFEVKRLLKLLLYLAPNFVKQLAQARRDKKLIAFGLERQKIRVTKDVLNEAFNNLNLDSDVFVHSSLMHIGRIEGGYKEVVRHLNERVLERGHTLLFSALSYRGSSEAFLKNKRVFDIRLEPVEMGAINAYYASLPMARRSLSPTHSVCAIGPDAVNYTNEHHLSVTPFTQQSPYFKLTKNKGKVLMIGAPMIYLTILHVITDLLEYEVAYTKKSYPVEVINEEGDKYKGYYKAHDGLRALMRNPTQMLASVKKMPSTKVFPLGGSELILLDSVDMMLCMLEFAKKGFCVDGKFCAKKYQEKINRWIIYFKSL